MTRDELTTLTRSRTFIHRLTRDDLADILSLLDVAESRAVKAEYRAEVNVEEERSELAAENVLLRQEREQARHDCKLAESALERFTVEIRDRASALMSSADVAAR